MLRRLRKNFRNGAPTPDAQIQPKQSQACNDEKDRQYVQQNGDHVIL
jgi:hypothetical protein